MTEFSLMQGTRVGKRYCASKQFYRYVRPGARMVRSVSDDPQVLAAAFTHERIGNFVSVLINGARSDKTVRLVADGVPAELDAYVTSAATPLGTQPSRVERDAIVLPARSVMTLVSGSYLDAPSAAAPSKKARPENGSPQTADPAGPKPLR